MVVMLHFSQCGQKIERRCHTGTCTSFMTDRVTLPQTIEVL
jgi:hypothetical protein